MPSSTPQTPRSQTAAVGWTACIHRAAGPELLAECKALGGCATGHAKLTKGYALPCRYVIHTVGPQWCGGAHGECEQLAACYRSSLALALEHACESVAFPRHRLRCLRVSEGFLALRTAIDAIGDFLLAHDMTVYLVIFDRKAYQIGSKLFADITAYIDDRYAAARADERGARQRRVEAYPVCGASVCMQADAAPAPRAVGVQHPGALKDALEQLDESFSEMLLRKIDERGMTDAQCYKKANIDRKLFSKIRSDKGYKPSKPTVIAFAIALELPLNELQDMLRKAGFALSHSNKFDIIVEFFVAHGNYNVFEINEALFAFDQSLIGA